MIFVVSDSHQKSTIFEISGLISDIIRIYESMVIFDEYKIDYFPKELI